MPIAPRAPPAFSHDPPHVPSQILKLRCRWPEGYPFDTREELIPLKRLIWLYLGLLIFEGALRKWLLPGLANPLLIACGPVIILVCVVAYGLGVFPRNAFIAWIIGLGIVSALHFRNSPGQRLISSSLAMGCGPTFSTCL